MGFALSDPDRLCAVLGAAGWRVTAAPNVSAALAVASSPPDLILVDAAMAEGGAHAVVEAVRAGGGAGASVPILALVAPGVDPGAGFDGRVRWPTRSTDLVRAIASWRPDDAADTLARLRTRFGDATILAMAGRLRALLIEALAALDAGPATELAHRVAGVAGTLGFDAAGRAWLALSEGDAAAETRARRESRRAIAIINRQESATDPKT